MAPAIMRPGRGERGIAPWRRVALGAAAVCAIATLQRSFGFVGAPARAEATRSSPAPWVSSSVTERMEAPRGESEARTQMRNRLKDEDRTRKQGGGRNSVSMSRKPVLGGVQKNVNSFGGEEKAGSVVSRLFGQVDMNFATMTAQRKRFFRPLWRDKNWIKDYNFRLRGQSTKAVKDQLVETQWKAWISTVGKKRGYLEPVTFDGPALAGQDDVDFNALKQKYGTPQELSKFFKMDEPEEKKTPMERAPDWVKDGKFPAKDDPENMFNVWKRPLHRYPYDIGRRGSKTKYTRGNVV